MATFGTSSPAPSGGGYVNFGSPTFQRVIGLPRPSPVAPVRTTYPAQPFRPTDGGGSVPMPPLRSIGPAYSGPTGTMNQNPAQTSTGIMAPSSGTQAFDMGATGAQGPIASGVTSSGFDISNIPWYVWAAIALAAFFILAQPRELHIKA